MKKTALVLSGGGSRGAYEIGVWKALRELGIRLDIITGTSVGSINGAMIAQGDLELTEKLWKQLETEMVFDIDDAGSENGDNSRYEIAGIPAAEALAYAKEIVLSGGAGSSGLRKLLDEYIDENAVRSSGTDYGLVTTSYPDFRGSYLFLEDIPEG
ncbi:MAG: patatin-like phospholipase family protein, partial [Lentihominibacter sp.]